MYVSAVSKMFLVPTCGITARPGIGMDRAHGSLRLTILDAEDQRDFSLGVSQDAAYGCLWQFNQVLWQCRGMAAALVRDSYAMLGPPNRARSKLCIVHGQAISFQEAHFVRICGRCSLLA